MKEQKSADEQLLELLEQRKPDDILVSEYRGLLEHFQHWYNCNSPLAVRAKAVLTLAHPHIQKKLEE